MAREAIGRPRSRGAARIMIAVALAACGGGGGGRADAPAGDGAPSDATPDAGPTPDAGGGGAFLDPAVLHVIDIAIAPGDLAGFDEDQQTRVPCDVTIDGTLLAQCGCRKKGGVGSVDPASAKPAFSIKLDEYVPGQKYAGVDKLVLNNAISDPSLLHEHVVYAAFEALGVPAHRTAFVETTFQGVPRGIYVAVEPIDKEFLRARFGAAEDAGNLYESAFVDFALDPDAMDLKDPQGRSRADMTAVAAAVTTSSDAELATAVGALLDLEEYTRFFALEIFFDAEDSLSFGRNNYYMYHRADQDRFVFIAHGQDVVLGNPAFDRTYPPAERLAARVDALPALRAQVDAALDAAMAPGGAADPAALDSRITDAMALIASSQRTDDFTRGDLALVATHGPELAAQLAYRATYLATGGPFPECGDGVVQGLEQCDDGDTDPGDGCDPTCVPECGSPFVAGGTTWVLCPGGRDWTAQVARCQAVGGALAFPADAADYATMVAAVRRRLGATDFWIGLTDGAVEDQWRTPGGAVAPYLAFAPNEPNGGGGENCMLSDSGQFRDRSCDQPFPVLCRMP